jgi:uncharacterized membrane protein/protein-disulfide isomerase
VARKSPSNGAKGLPGAAENGRLAAPLRLFVAVSIAGFGFALAASYVHYQLDSSGGEYVSFCNINERVNCDMVLSSTYSRLLGVPVAWLGAAAHTVLALLAVAAMRSSGDARRLRLRFLVLGTLGGSVFSAYMAFLSFRVLGTACLMCMGLYAASAAQLAIVPALLGNSKSPNGGPLLSARTLSIALVAMLVAVVVAGRILWPPAPPASALGGASLTELRELDPKFFDWYLGQPVVEAGKLGGRAPAGTVVIIEFSDFQCGYCKRNHHMVEELRLRRSDSVAVIHRNFPLDPACNDGVDRVMHPQACRAAEAAECADAQGGYERMATVLFDNQDRLFESNFVTLAERAGLDLPLFDECMQKRTTLPKIAADSREGKRLEITSTPTLFLNGRRIRGTFDAPEKYDLAVAIELRLAAGESPPPQKP